MSNESEHIAIANRNQAVLDVLLRDLNTCAEWAAVVAFYKAVHILEAVFARETPSVHMHSHHERLERLKTTRRYLPFYPSFRPLWAASVVARYLEDRAPVVPGKHPIARPYSRFEDYLPASRLRTDLLDRYLQPLENMAVSMLSPGGGALVRYTPAPTTPAPTPP
jgi:hypothetical protein